MDKQTVAAAAEAENGLTRGKEGLPKSILNYKARLLS
jgi:hypothetical protein